MTHLGPVGVQSHVQAVVGGHQVGPGSSSVSALAVDRGGFAGSVGAQREVKTRVFGAAGPKGADPNRPALVTERMGAVVKHTYGKQKERLDYLYTAARTKTENSFCCWVIRTMLSLSGPRGWSFRRQSQLHTCDRSRQQMTTVEGDKAHHATAVTGSPGKQQPKEINPA